MILQIIFQYTRYSRNGDAIQATQLKDWAYSRNAGYCKLGNDIYYNWLVVNDNRNICPEGFHIPNTTECNELINYLGGQNVACKKLAELVEVGGGDLASSGTPSNSPHWWTQTQLNTNAYCIRFTYMESCSVELVGDNAFEGDKMNGYYVKCIKDDSTK